jgi:hypothetical protein
VLPTIRLLVLGVDADARAMAEASGARRAGSRLPQCTRLVRAGRRRGLAAELAGSPIM